MAEPRPLTPDEVSVLLRATGEGVEAELTDLADDVAAWHPAEGEWCVKQCLGHIVESERRGFNGRIRQILEEPGRKLAGWDRVEVATRRRDCEKPMRELLEEFLGQREDSVGLVQGLLLADLSKSGEHEEVGELRVEDLLHEWVHHDRNHFRQIQANLQAYVWPSMGNARKFADE